MDFIIKTNILQYIGFYKERIEVKVSFERRLWGIDGWFSYKGVESLATIDLSYSGLGGFTGSHQRDNSG